MDWNEIKNLPMFRDLTSIGIANIAGSGISAVFWFYLASLVGEESYGEISYLIAIAGVVSTVSLLGFSNAVTVYTAKKVNLQATAFLISLISSAIGAGILFVMFEEIGMSLYAIGYVIYNLGIAELLGRKAYKKYSYYFIIQKGLIVIFAISLYFVMGPIGVVFGFGLSFLPFSIRIYKGFKETKINFSLIRSRVGFIVNSFTLDISRIFSGQTDKLIIGPLFGFILLGNYHLGIQFLSLMSLLPSILLQYTLPQDASGVRSRKLKKLTIIASIGFAIIGITLIPLVVPILFPDFEESILIIQIISVAVIPRTITTTYISKFLGMEKTRFVVIGSIIFLTIQIPSIFILGQIFGISGAAIALVLGEIAQVIFLVIADKIFLKNSKF